MTDYQINNRLFDNDVRSTIAESITFGKHTPVITITCGAVITAFWGLLAYSISKGYNPTIRIKNIFSVSLGKNPVNEQL